MPAARGRIGLARRGRQGAKDPRSHQGPPATRPVASGASVPGRDGIPMPSPGARRDVTGIPVSVLPSGGRSRGPRAVDPWTLIPRARAFDLPARSGSRHTVAMPPDASPIDVSLPILPIDQPARLEALEAAVRARTSIVPELGIVLGSGLGDLADELRDGVAIPFGELPGWPAATAPGHAGRLLLAQSGRALLCRDHAAAHPARHLHSCARAGTGDS